jgi:hypothetical protein
VRTGSNRRVVLALTAALALAGVGCSSPPPPKLVALEMIQTLDDPSMGSMAVSSQVVDCMTAKVEAMTEEYVAAIASTPDQLTVDAFSAELAQCLAADS